MRKQRGGAMVEWIIVVLGLMVIWMNVDKISGWLSEHQDEYTWSISQPF